MSFLFGSKPKAPEKPIASLDPKSLKLRLQKLAEENQSLKDQFEEQKQVALCNKKLLGMPFFVLFCIETKKTIDEYIGKVTTHDNLVAKLTATMKDLKEKTDSQEKLIRCLRYK